MKRLGIYIGIVRESLSRHIIAPFFLMLFALPLFADSSNYAFYYNMVIPESFSIAKMDNPDSSLVYYEPEGVLERVSLTEAKTVEIAKLQLYVTSTGQKQFSFTLSPIDTANSNKPYFQSGNGKIYYTMSYTSGSTYLDFRNGSATIIRVIDDISSIGTEVTICTFRITVDQESLESAPQAQAGQDYSASMTITYTGV